MDRAVKQAVVLQNAALKKAGLTRASGPDRRLGGRPDAGVRVGRGRDEAHQGEQGERDHRGDGVERDDPDGTIRDHPEQRPPRLADVERAADQRPQGQGASCSGRIRRTRSRARCSAGAALTKFGKGAKLNVGARNDAFGTALQALFVSEWKRLGGTIGTSVAWNPDQANFDTDAAKLVDGSPAGMGRDRLSRHVREVRPVARPQREVERVEDARDRGPPQCRDARQDRRPGEGPERIGRERGRRPRRQGVRCVLEEVRQGREAVHRVRGNGVRRGDDRVPRGGTRLLGVAGEDEDV